MSLDDFLDRAIDRCKVPKLKTPFLGRGEYNSDESEGNSDQVTDFVRFVLERVADLLKNDPQPCNPFEYMNSTRTLVEEDSRKRDYFLESSRAFYEQLPNLWKPDHNPESFDDLDSFFGKLGQKPWATFRKHVLEDKGDRQNPAFRERMERMLKDLKFLEVTGDLALHVRQKKPGVNSTSVGGSGQTTYIFPEALSGICITVKDDKYPPNKMNDLLSGKGNYENIFEMIRASTYEVLNRADSVWPKS